MLQVRIYRQTECDDLKAVFFPGSAIRSRDLNDNFEPEPLCDPRIRPGRSELLELLRLPRLLLLLLKPRLTGCQLPPVAPSLTPLPKPKGRSRLWQAYLLCSICRYRRWQESAEIAAQTARRRTMLLRTSLGC